MKTVVAQKKDNNQSNDHSLQKSPAENDNTNEPPIIGAGTPIFLKRDLSASSAQHPADQRQADEEKDEGIIQPQPLVQRQVLEEEEEPIQAKLTIGTPDDEYEQEADQVAEMVLRTPDTSIVKPVDEDEKGDVTPQNSSTVQTKAVSPLFVQRLCAECQEENQQDNSQTNTTSIIQRKSKIQSPLSSTHRVAKTIQSPSGGRPLPQHFQTRVGKVLGSDLSHVKVHDDSSANEAADSINAKAYTHQNHIYIGKGQRTNDVQLMAHELTHVIQQSSHTYPAPTVQRNETDTTDDVELEPQHENQSIAVWEGFLDATIQTDRMMGSVALPYHWANSAIPLSINPEGWTRGHYGSEAAAMAAIRTAATAGAVFIENGRYVAYRVTEPLTIVYSFNYDNITWFDNKPWTRLRFTSSATVMITEDGAAVRPQAYKPSEEAAELAMDDQALMPGADNLLSGYQEAFGDFNEMSQPIFIRLFAAAMKDNALTILSRGRGSVENDVERFSTCGMVTQEEIERMRTTATRLAQIDSSMEAVPPVMVAPDYKPPPSEIQCRMDVNARNQRRRAERATILRDYPTLARFDDMEEFAGLEVDEQLSRLGIEARGILEDIDTSRNNILNVDLDLWTIQSVVDATIAGLNITDDTRRGWVTETASSHRAWDTATTLGLAVFSIVFGVGAAVASGGLSLAFAAGALGLGAADAIRSTDDYFAESAAGNTAMNPEESIVPPDLAGHWAWLVVAWAGVGLDALDVVRAVRAVQAAGGIIEEGVVALSHGDEAFARSLRTAAGEFEAGETITEATRAVLSRRVGTEINIVEAGIEIRVHYVVDSRGRTIVRGVQCGSEALVSDILAHADVVRLLNRYDGVTGRLRQLWDRLLSLAGRPNADVVNPFRPGSMAFESWLEMKKLPGIIETRRAALGDVIGTAQESILRRDVEFLESELEIHRRVVNQMTMEKGLGYVASARNRTAEAIASGDVPVLEGHSLIRDASQYYYRIRPNRPPPYDLVRFADSTEPPRTLVRSSSGGWDIAEGTLSRAEAGRRMVEGWPDHFPAAFQRVIDEYPAAQQVVPLTGVGTTGRRIGELDPLFRDNLAEILETAFRRAGDHWPAARAAEVAESVVSHEIVVVRGTDQLRAFNYRLDFANTAGEAAEGDLHHLIPLYLGGNHRQLVDVQEDLHRRLHDLIDELRLDETTTLAPHSIQRSGAIDFANGAAVINPDGSVQLVRLNPDGTYTPVP